MLRSFETLTLSSIGSSNEEALLGRSYAESALLGRSYALHDSCVQDHISCSSTAVSLVWTHTHFLEDSMDVRLGISLCLFLKDSSCRIFIAYYIAQVTNGFGCKTLRVFVIATHSNVRVNYAVYMLFSHSNRFFPVR